MKRVSISSNVMPINELAESQALMELMPTFGLRNEEKGPDAHKNHQCSENLEQ